MRVVFTGGSGKAGRHVVPYLRDKGHEILNLDLVPLDCPGVNTLITDVTDLGQVFNALTMHFGFEGYDTGKGPAKVDAVVHFAAVPRVLIVPDNEVFRINVMSTYNMIEAAVKLGIRKVVIASSETTYGVCFAEGERDFGSLPLEEDDDVDPMDSYALSKVVNEKNARAFALRTGADIYALRIGNVIEPHEYDRFPGFHGRPGVTQAQCLELHRRARSRPDRRSMPEEDGLGFEVFNAANDTITANEPTEEFLKRWAPNTPRKRVMGSARRHTRTARSARCSASRKSTTGGSMFETQTCGRF